jgi:DNA invertase Pin-like site-specific DNA recombinase
METPQVYLGQKRVAIYCRASTDKQDCERQRRDLTEFAARAGYEVVDIFEEYASGEKDNRLERAKVLALVQARKIDIIFVTELSRWGRSTADLISTAQELRSRNVSLIAQTGLQFDFDSPQGKLLYTMLAGFAEFERDLIRERVRSGLAAAQSRGVKLGRKAGQVPQRVSQLESQVKQLHQDGKSYRAIASELSLSKNTVMKICNERNNFEAVTPYPERGKIVE